MAQDDAPPPDPPPQAREGWAREGRERAAEAWAQQGSSCILLPTRAGRSELSAARPYPPELPTRGTGNCRIAMRNGRCPTRVSGVALKLHTDRRLPGRHAHRLWQMCAAFGGELGRPKCDAASLESITT